jgi:hypothetical protein
MMWAPKNEGDPPKTIGMSLDKEGHVRYLVGEKRIEGGGNKKEAVGKFGSFVVVKELGMTLKDSKSTTNSTFKFDLFLHKQDVAGHKMKCSPKSITSLVSASSLTFK